MTDKPENPPAFPFQPLGQNGDPCAAAFTGMLLRDYFAGMALQGMASAMAEAPPDKTVASIAYRLADAMLSERTKP